MEDQEIIETLKAIDKRLETVTLLAQSKQSINLNIPWPISLKFELLMFTMYLAALTVAFSL